MIVDKITLKEYLEADKSALGRKRKHPTMTDYVWRYQIYLRKCEYYRNIEKTNLFNKLASLYFRYQRFLIGSKCGFSIPLNVVGKGLCIAHIGPIVISEYAKLGENCRIHICVNIGADARDSFSAPHLGNNVYIGPGAKIYGKVVLADNIAIGANAVVNKSFFEKGISIGGGTC